MFSESLLTLARPYAQAVFDFACKQNTLAKWELMLVCVKNIIQSPMVIKLLSIVDSIGSVELSEIFFSISQHELDCFGQNFIRILSEYKRLFLIPIILDEFIFLRKRRELITELEIITPILLDDNTVSKIVSVVKEKFSCDVDVICKLDPSIISGIILHINNFVIDGSLKGRIKHLKYFIGK